MEEKTFEAKVLDALDDVNVSLTTLLAVEGTLTELQTLPAGLVSWVDVTQEQIKLYKKAIIENKIARQVAKLPLKSD